MVSSKNRSGMGGLPHLGFDGAERWKLDLAATCSISTSRWSVVACFSGFQSKARGGVAPGDLDDASWLDGGV
jgi:hypothetical protein